MTCGGRRDCWYGRWSSAFSDNVLRPVLIRRGARPPLPLIIAGAIGGLVGLGLIGLFVGPVILAVTYRLLEWWMADAEPQEEAAG